MKSLEDPRVVATVVPIHKMQCVTCGTEFFSDELLRHAHEIKIGDVGEPGRPRLPVTQETAGSNPVVAAKFCGRRSSMAER